MDAHQSLMKFFLEGKKPQKKNSNNIQLPDVVLMVVFFFLARESSQVNWCVGCVWCGKLCVVLIGTWKQVLCLCTTVKGMM